MLPGVTEAIKLVKELGYLVIVITNQAGISRGIYSRQQMQACHQYMQEATGHLINAVYYSPYHPSVTNSIGRKPGTLMVERAAARFNIALDQSWFVGDMERDMECGHKAGLKLIRVVHATTPTETIATNRAGNLLEAINLFIRPEAGLIADMRDNH